MCHPIKNINEEYIKPENTMKQSTKLNIYKYWWSAAGLPITGAIEEKL